MKLTEYTVGTMIPGYQLPGTIDTVGDTAADTVDFGANVVEARVCNLCWYNSTGVVVYMHTYRLRGASGSIDPPLPPRLPRFASFDLAFFLLCLA